MNSRVLSSFKTSQTSSQVHKPNLSKKSSPAPSQNNKGPSEGMIKQKPPQDLSEDQIRAKLSKHFDKGKSSQKANEGSEKKASLHGKDRETAKNEAHEKAKKDVGKGVKVKKPDVNANDPSDPNTREKIKDAINNNLVNFSSKEKHALSNIIADKEG